MVGTISNASGFKAIDCNTWAQNSTLFSWPDQAVGLTEAQTSSYKGCAFLIEKELRVTSNHMQICMRDDIAPITWCGSENRKSVLKNIHHLNSLS